MLKPYRKVFLDPDHPKGVTLCSGGIASTPKFFKHYFHVFTPKSECEGEEFFEKTAKLTMAQWGALMDELKRDEIPCLLYIYKTRRRFPGMPSDLKSKAWKDYP